MLSIVKSSAVLGVDAYIVEVETDISQQLPAFATVGLPEAAVKESKDRVTAAIKNSGYLFPNKRITVNLAPADIRKEGTAFDLPISIGILGATGQLDHAQLGNYVLAGELSLDGSLRPVRGVLAMAVAARSGGLQGMIVPEANAREAAVADGLPVYPVDSLEETAAGVYGKSAYYPHDPTLQFQFGIDMVVLALTQEGSITRRLMDSVSD